MLFRSAEKPLKEHLEVIGYRDAFEYIITLVDVDFPLLERVIKEIHSLVLMNDWQNRGVYRSVPVTIVGASHTPPQPYLVPVQMERLLSDYTDMKKRLHTIEAVAEFHLRFEGIHPFIDGNGRTGRLVMNLELIKAGLLPVDIKFADRRKYYDTLYSYSSAALVELLAQYEIAELEKRINIMRMDRD